MTPPPLRIAVQDANVLIDQLVERKLLTGKVAAAKLESLRRESRFFPERECQIRLERWRAG